MDKPSELSDWSHLQSFLAVADTGSLSAAAAVLGQSQPTIGRHIKALETRMGLELFQRHARGLRLSAAGQEILPHARDMQFAMHRLALTAEARSGQLSGPVRIACSIFAAHHVLPPLVAQLRKAAPSIQVIIQARDDSDSLHFREADIALRMYRPTQLDLVTRHVADIQIGVFAAQSYLGTRPRPTSFSELLSHDVVGFDKSTLIIDVMRAMGHSVTPDQFAVRTDNQTAYWEMVRAGCGIGFTQAHVGRADTAVEEIFVDFTIPALPVWLTAHEAQRKTPRVSAVWDLIAENLPALVA